MIDRFDLAAAELLGQGGEAQVYALDAERVVRLYRGDAPRAYIERRRRFYARLLHQHPPFAVPNILATGAIDGRVYTVEARMCGSDFSKVLSSLTGRERERALVSYLDVAAQIGTIRFPSARFGELLVPGAPLQRTKWARFLWDRMQVTLRRSRADLQRDIPQFDTLLDAIRALLRQVADVDTKCLVHGDYFPGNVYIADDLTICGVGDFGVTTVVGDPRMDLAGAVVFVEVVDAYRPDDTGLLLERLAARYGASMTPILQLYRLYYSIYFSHCKEDDPPTYRWCVRNLRAYQLALTKS